MGEMTIAGKHGSLGFRELGLARISSIVLTWTVAFIISHLYTLSHCFTRTAVSCKKTVLVNRITCGLTAQKF